MYERPDHAEESTQDRIQRVLEGVLGIPFTHGNHVTVLKNGDEIFPAMLEAIDAAQSRIEFLTFVYWTGDIARRFAHALAQRARAGVNVRVLLDAVGANEMSRDLIRLLEEAGADVQWFRPVTRWKVWEVDNRTHRKVLVVDGLVGFTGGVGIAREWEGDARNPNEWRDTHFRIVGPAVQGLQGAFYGNWAETGHRIFNPMDTMPQPEHHGRAMLQIVRATASTGWSDIASLIQLLVSVAEQRVRIASAYFVPDEETIAQLTETVSRGVEVEVMLPGPYTDERVSQLAGEAGFRSLLEGGVKLWKFQPSMLHTKIMTIDGEAACIGSANFNQRSMRKDDELAVVVLNSRITARLDGHYDEDLARCEAVTLHNWKRRGRLQRLMEAAALPFRSQT